MRWRRMGAAIAALGAGVIVGGAGAAYVVRDALARRAAAYGTALARERLGLRVTVGPATLTGPLSVRLQDVHVAAPGGAGEVRVRTVEASLRPGALLRGRPALRTVRLLEPSVDLESLAALRRALRRPEPSRGEAGADRAGRDAASPSWPAPEIVVEGGGVRYAGQELALSGVWVALAPSAAADGGWTLRGGASLPEGVPGRCAASGSVGRAGGWRIRAQVRCDRPVTLPLPAARLGVRFQGLSVDAGTEGGGRLEADLAEAALVRMDPAGPGVGDVDLLVGQATVRTAGPGRARLDARVRPGHGPGALTLSGLLDAHGPSAVLDVGIQGFDLAETPLKSLLPFEVLSGGLSADVAVDLLDGLMRADVTGAVSVEDLAVAHPWLAPAPVGGLRATLDLDVAVDVAARSVEVFRNVWTVGGLPIEVDGRAAFSGRGVRVMGSVRSGPHDGAILARALPPALIPTVSPLELEGPWQADVTFDVDTAAPDNLHLDVTVDTEALRAVSLGSIDMASVLSRFDRRYADPETDEERSFPAGPRTPGWTPLERIPSALQVALIAQEDGGFYRHQGFSLLHVRGALQRDIEESRLARGASTLSMQTVKNVFLSPHKTLSRKLQEVLLTWQLERFLDKADILEIYLNVIEWGPRLFGVRAAARHYFDQAVEDLTPLQCLYLATMVPSPRRYHREFAEGRLGRRHKARIERLFSLLVRRGRLTPEEQAAAAALDYTPRLAAYVPIPDLAQPDPPDAEAGAVPDAGASPPSP